MADQFDALFNQSVGAVFAPGSMALVALRLGLVLYAGLAAPALPPMLMNLFDMPLFRVAVLMMVVWIGGVDPSTALMVAIGFIVSMNALAGRRLLEAFGGMDMEKEAVMV